MEAVSFRTKIKQTGGKNKWEKGILHYPPPHCRSLSLTSKVRTAGVGGGGKTLPTHILIPPYDNNTNHISHVNETSTQPYKFLVWYIKGKWKNDKKYES